MNEKEKIQAILFDLAGEVADIKEKHFIEVGFTPDEANTDAGDWFTEIAKDIRNI